MQQVHVIDEHFWKVSVIWSLSLSITGGIDKTIALLNNGPGDQLTVKTTGKKPNSPFKEKEELNDSSVEMTWLVMHLADGIEDGGGKVCDPDRGQREAGVGSVRKQQIAFNIARDAATCYTPRRNKDIEEALRYARGVSDFVNSVKKSLFRALLELDDFVDLRDALGDEDGEEKNGMAKTKNAKAGFGEIHALLDALESDLSLVPTGATFALVNEGDRGAGEGASLTGKDIAAFLGHSQKRLHSLVSEVIPKNFVASGEGGGCGLDASSLATQLEARLAVGLVTMSLNSCFVRVAVDQIELMLTEQLRNAVVSARRRF